MDTIQSAITVDAPVEVAFKVYTEEIDLWWPRQGIYRYTFAPPDVEPDRILFEPQEGGRYYEIFGDGTEYDIGVVTVFEPPHRFVYTWQAPDWPVETTIEVTFSAAGDGTLVELTQSGFEAVGVEKVASGYADGLEEVLSVFGQYVAEH